MSRSSVLITPSILSADLGHLQDEIESVEDHADWLQIDVMDGHFVPNLSFGAPVVKCLKTRLPIDVHLMVSNPSDRIGEFQKLHVKHITFHAEAVRDSKARRALLQAIRKSGATAGIALNPETPLTEIEDSFDDIDLLLVMSVHPGFGGQGFIAEVLAKVSEAHAKRPGLMIQMDGGVDQETAVACRSAGATNLVAGNFIFSAKDRAKAISQLRG
jgi:ribulose-phosphate 3-epimerase